MGIEEKLNARDIISTFTGMSTRPEFYSGRGATTSDLNDRTLEKIYGAVEKEYEEKAAGEFVKMVANIKVLSATDFLLSFYELERTEWKYNKKKGAKKNGLYVDGKNDEEVRTSAMFTVTQVMGGTNERDETASIRNWFLSRHGIKPKEGKKYSQLGYVIEY